MTDRVTPRPASDFDQPRQQDLLVEAHSREYFAAVPEAAGLFAISQGFPFIAKSDPDTLERATFLYDALYAFVSGSACTETEQATRAP